MPYTRYTTLEAIQALWDSLPDAPSKQIMTLTRLARAEDGGFDISFGQPLPEKIIHYAPTGAVTLYAHKKGQPLLRRFRRYTPFIFESRHPRIWKVSLPEELEVTHPSVRRFGGLRKGWLFKGGITFDPVAKTVTGAADIHAYYTRLQNKTGMAEYLRYYMHHLKGCTLQESPFAAKRLAAEYNCALCLVVDDNNTPLYELYSGDDHLLDHIQHWIFPVIFIRRALMLLPISEQQRLAIYIEGSLHPKTFKPGWANYELPEQVKIPMDDQRILGEIMLKYLQPFLAE
jgi:hypothetical protein